MVLYIFTYTNFPYKSTKRHVGEYTFGIPVLLLQICLMLKNKSHFSRASLP